MADSPKPGQRTTEFGIAGLVGGLTVFNDHLAGLSTEQLWALVVVAVAYILSRTIVKWGASIYEIDPDVKALGEEVRKVKK